jgi:hypothetical protein
LPEPASVSLNLYDIAGKRVRTLAGGEQLPGVYHVPLTVKQGMRRLATGVYFVRLETQNHREVKKVVVGR